MGLDNEDSDVDDDAGHGIVSLCGSYPESFRKKFAIKFGSFLLDYMLIFNVQHLYGGSRMFHPLCYCLFH